MDLSYLRSKSIKSINCPKCHSTKANALVSNAQWIENDEGETGMRVPFLCKKCNERYAVILKPINIIPNAWEFGGVDEQADTTTLSQ